MISSRSLPLYLLWRSNGVNVSSYKGDEMGSVSSLISASMCLVVRKK